MQGHDADFKNHHLALIDLLDDDEELKKEQRTLDDHEETVSNLLVRLKKTELTDISRNLLSMDLDDHDELVESQTALEGKMFQASLDLKRILASVESTPAATSTKPSTKGSGVKLPKIDAPVFNGNILQWTTFWEQFSVAVHSRSDLLDSEKLVHAVKDGAAKGVIEGLSRSGDCYDEAVECLKSRYNRPRLIHQAHVRKILEVPALKEGNGKELRLLHDTIQQHLRALKVLGYEPSGPFITSTLELKLDPGTMFEWQKHSQEESKVPHYKNMLDFLNMRAQASECSVSEKLERDPPPTGRLPPSLPAQRRPSRIASSASLSTHSIHEGTSP